MVVWLFYVAGSSKGTASGEGAACTNASDSNHSALTLSLDLVFAFLEGLPSPTTTFFTIQPVDSPEDCRDNLVTVHNTEIRLHR